MSRVVALSGELFSAYQRWRQPGNMSTHPALDAEVVLELEALRTTLLALQYQHEQIMSHGGHVSPMNDGSDYCPGCLWCHLPEAWQRFAEGRQ